MAAALAGLGIIAEKAATIPSGFVEIGIYRLTDKGLALFK